MWSIMVFSVVTIARETNGQNDDDILCTLVYDKGFVRYNELRLFGRLLDILALGTNLALL